jgi:hypothetical protein
MKQLNREVLDELNSIDARARDEGAHAYFMFPSLIDRAYTMNVAAIDSLRRRIDEDMTMPIIGTPKDFVYPGDHFFDTRYHLRWEARPSRTMEMVKLLRQAGAKDGWLPRRIAGSAHSSGSAFIGSR